MNALWAVAEGIARAANAPKIIVIKSTVPVGTNGRVHNLLAKASQLQFDVVSNPEFMKEGAALDDFMKPDRVVIGIRRPELAEVLREVYSPFIATERPFLVMSPKARK